MAATAETDALMRFMYGGRLPPTRVLPWLYISDMTTAKSLTMLNDASITRVVVATAPDSCGFPHAQHGIEYMRGAIDDDAGLLTRRLFRFICSSQAPEQSVLVHCEGGISRSASIIVAVLMLGASLDYDAALAFLRRSRRLATPNPGFDAALRAWADSPEFTTLASEFDVVLDVDNDARSDESDGR